MIIILLKRYFNQISSFAVFLVVLFQVFTFSLSLKSSSFDLETIKLEQNLNYHQYVFFQSSYDRPDVLEFPSYALANNIELEIRKSGQKNKKMAQIEKYMDLKTTPITHFSTSLLESPLSSNEILVSKNILDDYGLTIGQTIHGVYQSNQLQNTISYPLIIKGFIPWGLTLRSTEGTEAEGCVLFGFNQEVYNNFNKLGYLIYFTENDIRNADYEQNNAVKFYRSQRISQKTESLLFGVLVFTFFFLIQLIGFEWLLQNHKIAGNLFVFYWNDWLVIRQRDVPINQIQKQVLNKINLRFALTILFILLFNLHFFTQSVISLISLVLILLTVWVILIFISYRLEMSKIKLWISNH
jgi:hypothetical protein